jgi:hypothetical protein
LLLRNAAQRRFQLADEQLQFELAKFREDLADPAMDFGRSPE